MIYWFLNIVDMCLLFTVKKNLIDWSFRAFDVNNCCYISFLKMLMKLSWLNWWNPHFLGEIEVVVAVRMWWPWFELTQIVFCPPECVSAPVWRAASGKTLPWAATTHQQVSPPLFVLIEVLKQQRHTFHELFLIISLYQQHISHFLLSYYILIFIISLHNSCANTSGTTVFLIERNPFSTSLFNHIIIIKKKFWWCTKCWYLTNKCCPELEIQTFIY